MDRFNDLLDSLEKNGVVSGLLDYKSVTGWIQNTVIVDKKYGDKIRLILRHEAYGKCG